MNGKVSVSVMVLNWNGKHLLKDCLSSLMNQSYPNYEVILIDNASTDGSVPYVKEAFPEAKIIQNPENLGFCRGYNVGFRYAKSKYAIVLNNDTIVAKNFVEELVRVVESDELIGSVGCKIIQFDGSVKYGPIFTYMGFIQPISSLKSVETLLTNLANCGCAVLYRKSLIDRIGGFDPYFWSDWEDHDLGYRINLTGYKSVYTPKTYVLHVGGASHSIRIPPDRLSRYIRNMLYTHFKNYETLNLILRFPVLLVILTVKGLIFPFCSGLAILIKKFFPKKHFRYDLDEIAWRTWYMTFFKGYWMFLHNLRPILLQRKFLQRMRVISDNQIFVNTQENTGSSWSRFLRIGS